MRRYQAVALCALLVILATLHIASAESPSVVLVVAPEKVSSAEYWGTRKVLEQAGVKVVVACKKRSSVDNKGKKIAVDMTLDQVKPADFDAVAFIGGMGVFKYVGDPEAERVAKDTVAADKCLAAICAGPLVLGKAGLLKNKTITGYPTTKKKLVKFGANYAGGKVQKDGKLITGEGPEAAAAFGKALVMEVKK